MTRFPSLTTSADPRREIPDAASERLDSIHVALRSLDDEERRLSRIGFETPLERCREQRRYWTFLAGMFSISGEDDRPRSGIGGRSWRIDPSR